MTSSNTSISTSIDAIILKLQSKAGVKVSKSWLSACQSFIRSKNLDPNNEDSILYEILHCDLRQVITDTNHDGNIQPQHQSSPAMETLQRAITASLDGNCQSDIPSNSSIFRLMLQVEEILDVSKNAEARYSYGPAKPSSPSPIGPQKGRCLKLLLSDGRLKSSTSAPPMIGVEVKPIADISTHSNAGLKILIKAPLTIRYGVLMLHEGNTIVLGGNVPTLMEIQKKAVQLAEKNSVINADPTIRALVNRDENVSFGDDDEAEDEGEGASTDVIAQQQPIQIPNIDVARNTNSRISTAAATNASNNTSNSTSSISVFSTPQTVSTPNTNLTSRSNTIIASRNPYKSTTNSFTRIENDITSISGGNHTTELDTSISSNRQTPINNIPNNATGTKTPFNPYRQSKFSASTSSASTLVTKPTTPSMPQTNNTTNLKASSTISGQPKKNTIRNPYSKSITNGTNVQTMLNPIESTPHTRMKTTIPGSGRKNSPLDLSSPEDSNASSSRIQAPQQTPTHHKSTFTSKNTYAPMSPTALSTPISFDELHCILLEAESSPSIYKKSESKIFVVPSKLCKFTQFNIEKDRYKQLKKSKSSTTSINSSEGKKKRKYVYTVTSNWMGPRTSSSMSIESNSTQSIITCKVSNAILEEYFEVNADDMRKMSKSNDEQEKERSKKLVATGGEDFLADVNTSFQNYSMKFLYNYDEWTKLKDEERKNGVWLMILKKII